MSNLLRVAATERAGETWGEGWKPRGAIKQTFYILAQNWVQNWARFWDSFSTQALQVKTSIDDLRQVLGLILDRKNVY